MEYAPAISQVATLLADPKRSALLWALIDGASRGGDELARLAGVSLTSAGAHLSRLCAAGLLTPEARGRKRYFRIAGPEVGAAVEALAHVSFISAPRPSQPVECGSPVTAAMRQARCCGEHLGGEVAAALLQQLLARGWLEREGQQLRLTPRGASGLAAKGVFVQALPARERQRATLCEGWCGAGAHIGGALGACLLRTALQMNWLRRVEGARAFEVTRQGREALARLGEG